VDSKCLLFFIKVKGGSMRHAGGWYMLSAWT